MVENGLQNMGKMQLQEKCISPKWKSRSRSLSNIFLNISNTMMMLQLTKANYMRVSIPLRHFSIYQLLFLFSSLFLLMHSCHDNNFCVSQTQNTDGSLGMNEGLSLELKAWYHPCLRLPTMTSYQKASREKFANLTVLCTLFYKRKKGRTCKKIFCQSNAVFLTYLLLCYCIVTLL